MEKIIFTAIITIIITLCPVLLEAKGERTDRIWQLVPKRDGIVKLGYTYNSRSDVRNEPGSFSIHTVRFKGHVPIPIADNIIFAPGVLYDLHHFRLYNTINYLHQNSLNVHDVGPTLDAYITFGEKWMLDLNFIPLISSDMKGLGKNDFQFQGHVLAGWAFSEHASFFFGIEVNKDFWRYLPIPVIGFVVRPENSFFEFEMMLPSYVRADFRVADFCKLFIQGEFEGNVWYVRGDGTVPNHFGKLMDTHAGAGARFTIRKGLEMEAWGGVNPYRNVQFKDRAGLTIERRLDLAFFGQVNIVITPQIFN